MSATAQVLTPKLCRAARALLGWRLQDLSTHSSVPQSTLTAFEGKDEAGRLARLNNNAVVKAFEDAGLVFIAQGRAPAYVLHGVGVKEPSPPEGGVN